MKITQNIELEVEITQRSAYSVSALMKLNTISEVITTDNGKPTAYARKQGVYVDNDGSTVIKGKLPFIIV